MSSALTMLKTAVFVAMASAIVMTATAVKPGVLMRLRKARRMDEIIMTKSE
jgi:hypothetical protein